MADDKSAKTKKKAVAHRKSAEDRKELMVKVRVTEDQKRTLARAADRDGLDVSSWLRNLGLQRARELESKG